MRFGKLPHQPKAKDFLYKRYRTGTLPPVPASFGHQGLITAWGMLGNDQVGDCVIAGADHETMLWTKEGGNLAVFTAANALSDYSAITGYSPNDPNSDQGTEIRAALDYRRTIGMVDSKGKRHKIGAFLALDRLNLDEVLEAMYLFSAVEIGFLFPETAMDQFDAGQPWDVVSNTTPIEGGHDVPLLGYDGTYLYCVTWGKVQRMTVDFFKLYCDEAWAVLSEELLKGGVSPEGFDLVQLQADLAALADTPAPTPVNPAANEIILWIGQEVAKVDGVNVLLDQAPVIDQESERTLVPLRFLAEHFGYNVAWDGDLKQITLTKVGG